MFLLPSAAYLRAVSHPRWVPSRQIVAVFDSVLLGMEVESVVSMYVSTVSKYSVADALRLATSDVELQGRLLMSSQPPTSIAFSSHLATY